MYQIDRTSLKFMLHLLGINVCTIKKDMYKTIGTKLGGDALTRY